MTTASNACSASMGGWAPEKKAIFAAPRDAVLAPRLFALAGAFAPLTSFVPERATAATGMDDNKVVKTSAVHALSARCMGEAFGNGRRGPTLSGEKRPCGVTPFMVRTTATAMLIFFPGWKLSQK